MSYFGGGSSHQENYQMNMTNDYENNLTDSHNNMNSSFSNLREVDRSLNDFNTGSPRNNDDITNIGGYGESNGDGADGSPGIIEKKELKELEIYDPL